VCVLETKILPHRSRRAGLPEEVAGLIIDCSDEATVVNDADIPMNGGQPVPGGRRPDHVTGSGG
jgi:hypothetical protein